MTFTITIHTGNSAMETWFDIANTLRTVSMQLPYSDEPLRPDGAVIVDINGNKVGEWKAR